jgi:repressor LexA
MTTPQRRKMYEFISQHIEEHGYSPSFKEIAKGVGLSESSVSLVSRNVQALIEAGWLTHQKKGSRRRVIPAKSYDFSLPLLGRIAAGSPIEAVLDDHFVDLGALFKGSNHFMLEVKGDSMIEERIFDGDLVICKRREKAEEGEIVAVLIDQQEATLKRISYQLAGKITLVPANASLKSMVYLPHQVQIQGAFIATLRFKK